MKYAWMLLVAGVAVAVVSAMRQMDILVLQAGVLAAAAGVNILFLNAKRIEAMDEEARPDGGGPIQREAA